jgi:hypothetical protein
MPYGVPVALSLSSPSCMSTQTVPEHVLTQACIPVLYARSPTHCPKSPKCYRVATPTSTRQPTSKDTKTQCIASFHPCNPTPSPCSRRPRTVVNLGTKHAVLYPAVLTGSSYSLVHHIMPVNFSTTSSNISTTCTAGCCCPCCCFLFQSLVGQGRGVGGVTMSTPLTRPETPVPCSCRGLGGGLGVGGS